MFGSQFDRLQGLGGARWYTTQNIHPPLASYHRRTLLGVQVSVTASRCEFTSVIASIIVHAITIITLFARLSASISAFGRTKTHAHLRSTVHDRAISLSGIASMGIKNAFIECKRLLETEFTPARNACAQAVEIFARVCTIDHGLAAEITRRFHRSAKQASSASRQLAATQSASSSPSTTH